MLFVGIGGTLRAGSSSESALRMCLEAVKAAGHDTILLDGPQLELPLYDPDRPMRSAGAVALVESVRMADGVILASPGYHGGVSGLVKNALDYLEDTAGEAHPYFDGRPVGCITTAYGYPGAAAALAGLRSCAHALRGWPTPYGAAINSKLWRDGSGAVTGEVRDGLELVATQVVTLASALTVTRSGSGVRV
jgi:FMN reductase